MQFVEIANIARVLKFPTTPLCSTHRVGYRTCDSLIYGNLYRSPEMDFRIF